MFNDKKSWISSRLDLVEKINRAYLLWMHFRTFQKFRCISSFSLMYIILHGCSEVCNTHVSVCLHNKAMKNCASFIFLFEYIRNINQVRVESYIMNLKKGNKS